RAAGGARRAAPDTPAAPGALMQNTQLGELSVAMPASAPAITATYGTSPDQVMQVLAGVHQITQRRATAGSAAPDSIQASGQQPSEVTATPVASPLSGATARPAPSAV